MCLWWNKKKKEGRKRCRCISIWIHGFWIAHISEIIQWLSSERHKQVIRAGRILLQTPSSLMAPPQFSPSTHIHIGLVSYRLTWLMHKSRRELLKPVKEEWGMFFLEPNLDMVHFSLPLFPTTCKNYVFINLTKSSAKENLMLQYPRMQSFIWCAHKYKWYSASTQTWACFQAPWLIFLIKCVLQMCVAAFQIAYLCYYIETWYAYCAANSFRHVVPIWAFCHLPLLLLWQLIEQMHTLK